MEVPKGGSYAAPRPAHGGAKRDSQEAKPGGKADASEAGERKILVDQQPGRERIPEQTGERLTRSSSTHDDGRSNVAGYSPTMRRPDLVTFAAIIMFTLGGFHVLLAISEFANSTWVLSRVDIQLFLPILIIWGVIDLIIGAIALYAGFSILSGGTLGWLMGVAFACVGIIRWLFYIPVSPLLAIAIIALDVLIIYGMVKDSDYFQTFQSS